MTAVFGIVGDPIDQVRSPSLFNRFFREKNIDAVMVPMHVRPDGLSTFIDGARTIENLRGLIITVPHKIAVAGMAAKTSKRVTIAGSANTLRRCAEGWEADLFDGEGFVRGMDVAGYELEGKACAIVGCGGAGAAIALALLEKHVRQLSLWDQDRSRCESLRRRIEGAGNIPITLRPPNRSDDIAINATPVGMSSSDPLPFSLDDLKLDAVVADVIMKPPRTRLLESAAAKGLSTQEGRHMLDGQMTMICDFFGMESIGTGS